MCINRKMVFTLLTALLMVQPLYADDSGFKLNGKPVPKFAATVNGSGIPSQLLHNRIMNHQQEMQHVGMKLSDDDIEKIARQLLDKLIDVELIFQKGKNLNIKVSEENIKAQVDKIRSQFPSEELFQSALSFQHLNLDLVRGTIEKNLAEAEFIRINIAPNVKVDEPQIEAYYNSNSQMFSKPETYSVSHIYVAVISPGQQPKDKESRQRAKALFEIIEKDALFKIDMVLNKIANGDDFAELAKQYSEHDSTSDKGGNLGTIPLSKLPRQFSSVVEKLNPGETSKLIKSDFGYHIIKLNQKFPAQTKTLDEVRTEILNTLLKEEVIKKRKSLLTELRKKADIQLHF